MGYSAKFNIKNTRYNYVEIYTTSDSFCLISHTRDIDQTRAMWNSKPMSKTMGRSFVFVIQQQTISKGALCKVAMHLS